MSYKLWLGTACHHLRDGFFVGAHRAPRMSPPPGRRNTGLRTAATTSGVAKMSAFGHRFRRGQRAGAAPILLQVAILQGRTFGTLSIFIL